MNMHRRLYHFMHGDYFASDGNYLDLEANESRQKEDWLAGIKKLIANKYTRLYPDEYKILLCEIELEVNSVLLPPSKCVKSTEEYTTKEIWGKPYRIGKTKYYPNFLKRREVLRDTLFLIHPVMKSILALTVLTLPDLVIDLSKYRNISPIDVSKLEKHFKKDLQKVEKLLTKQWYPTITSIVCKEHSKKTTPNSFLYHFLQCVTTFITVQVAELKRRTMDDILSVVSDESRVPFIKMNLRYEGIIKVYPDSTEFYNIYKTLLTNIDAIAFNLTPLQTRLNLPCEREKIPTQVSETYSKQCCEKLRETADKLYASVLEYVQDVANEYEELCDVNLRDKVKEYIFQHRIFEDVLQKAHHFQKEREKLRSSLKNVYFSVGRLDQTILTQEFMNCVEDCHSYLGSHLISIHREEAQRIDKVFQDVENKTHTIPKCTEQLMEMTEFLKWARTELIKELRERATESFRNLVLLMDVTNISDDHMKLNSRNVRWLENIYNIFQLQNSHIMKYRQELEFVLGKKTELLNKSLEDLTPRLVIIELMDEIDNTVEYLPDIRKFLRKLEHYDEEVTWINKEEALFKFPLSTYPELDEHKNYILPFAELLNMIYKWQFTHKVWMESTLNYFQYDEVESQAAELRKTIEKKFTYYAIKFKQGDDSSTKRFQGNIDDADLANLPAPMKLCVKALQQIDEFESFLKNIKFLCSPNLKTSHRKEIHKISGIDVEEYAEGTLRTMKDLNLSDHLEELQSIFEGAEKDMNLNKMQESMFSEWSAAKFEAITREC